MTRQSALLAAGSNACGQLGLGHEKDANALQCCLCDRGAFPPTGFKVAQLSAGSNHAAALLCQSEGEHGSNAPDSELQLWVCGSGSQGQLGMRIADKVMAFRRLDLEEDFGLRQLLPSDSQACRWRPVRVACAWNSTFVVLRSEKDTDDDVLVVLGKDNDFGQLGLGETKWIESGVGLVDFREYAPAKGALRIDNLVCGLRHAVVECHVSLDNGVRCVQLLGWGAARHGQLDSQSGIKCPTSYWRPHLVDEWEVRQDCFEHGSILAAGKEHTVYRKLEYLKIIGSNRQGQRLVEKGVAGSAEGLLSAACTWNGTLVLSGDSILGSGKNDKGQLGARTNDNQIATVERDAVLHTTTEKKRLLTSLICGSEHAMVLVNKEHGGGDGQVWGWGWNEHGNLAQGNEEDQFEPVCIWPPPNDSRNPSPATNVWAGCGTTFVQILREQHTR